MFVYLAVVSLIIQAHVAKVGYILLYLCLSLCVNVTNNYISFMNKLEYEAQVSASRSLVL